MGPDGAQRSDHAQRMDIVSERDRQTRPMQRKRWKARSGQSKRAPARPPRQSGQGLQQEGARDEMGERLRLGLKQRNIGETGVGLPKEPRTLLRLAAAVRTTSKCAGSYRARREASDRGSKPIRKDIGLSTNDHLRS